MKASSQLFNLYLKVLREFSNFIVNFVYGKTYIFYYVTQQTVIEISIILKTIKGSSEDLFTI